LGANPAINSMKPSLHFAFGGWRASILVLVPATVLADLLQASAILVFVLSALSLVPLAALIGEATEQLAAHVGPTAGGLLNATLGNVTELLIGLLALWHGQLAVVKASITGSIIGNLLLVFGLAALVGGLKREKLVFDRAVLGANTTMLFLAVVALVMPALFQYSVFGVLSPTGFRIDRLSLCTALVLLASYVSGLIFVLRTSKNVFRGQPNITPQITRAVALTVLGGTTALIALASDILVRQIQPVTHALGWTELFVGIVIVAIVGNAAEHSAALVFAYHDQMDLALSIAIGSSTQIALFVAPLLVLFSLARPVAMSLVFEPLEIAAVIFSVGAVTLVASDGETNWFEGLQLLGVYLILAVFFFFLPAS
jgi:Ca2+:H+ antiporter